MNLLLLSPIKITGIDFEFFLFALTLLGVAMFHNHTLKVALAGFTAIIIYKLGFTNFDLLSHFWHEKSTVINLFGLLVGFAVLAAHFQETGIPELLPRYLPDDWKGPFMLLIIITILSSFLDNIAAAMIGGQIAFIVFNRRVHIGYIAAIVAASNAGGAGSVLGDTTTTMMWIDGVSAFDVLHAYVAVVPAVIIFGIIASFQQDKYQRIMANEVKKVTINGKKVFMVLLILSAAIATNVLLDFPALGVWAAILIGLFFTTTNWDEAKHAVSGSVFLLSLVLSASMMPVEQLPEASWQTTFGLGFVSAVFDNIPLTKLALTQGGYDWGVLAYAVGFGGSMVWFGSSAGVAISNIYPEAKSVWLWVKNGWHVVLGYVVGFAVLLLVMGWHPHTPHKDPPATNSQVSQH
jgi:Na+/H+ antiporter NhaD/arsenite permease-like protein